MKHDLWKHDFRGTVCEALSVKHDLTAAEAADRLGIKVASLYAYVSRGVLSRHSAADGRSSRFDASEVDELAASRRRSAGADPTGLPEITTAITQLGAGALAYRGRDAAECARTMTFESVAEWLWTGLDPGSTVTWASDPSVVALARRVSSLLPRTALLPDHLRVIVAAIATTDPLRFDVRPLAFTSAARNLIAGLVDALPQRRAGGVPRLQLASDEQFVSGSLAARLWLRLSPMRPDSALLRVLNAALVMMADHEMATSTFGVRIAASTRADPYACIAAGLGVFAGPLHGSASASVHDLLMQAGQMEGATAAVSNLLRQGERLPGFGHPQHADGDPRAKVLLDLLREAQPNQRRLAVVEGVLGAVGRRHPVAPNVDFAAAALAYVALMPRDACEVAFGVARCAGWIAHALEELQEEPLRFRPRARYVGPTSG